MAKGINITFDDKEFNKAIRNAVKKAPVAATKALMDCVLDLAGESARRAPIESGDLRNNCHATINNATVYENQLATGSPPSDIAPVGEVGYSLPYAKRQHEDLTLRHDRTDGYRILTGKNAGKTVNMVAGGEAKYLEAPFEERKLKYITHIEEEVRKALE